MAERKPDSHTGYIMWTYWYGTNLCTRDREPISLEKSMLKRGEAGQRNTKLIDTQTIRNNCKVLKRKLNYKFKSAFELLQNQ